MEKVAAPCDVCGEVGFELIFVICHICDVVQERRFCTCYSSLTDTDPWFCEQCYPSLPNGYPKLSSLDASEPLPATAVAHESKKSPSNEEEPASNGKAVQELSLPRRPRSKRTVYKRRFDGRFILPGSDMQEAHAYDPLHFEKYPSNFPIIEASWRGTFNIPAMEWLGELYNGFQTHISRRSFIMDNKAYQFSKKMPKVLQFELLPRSSIWNEIFQTDYALGKDITLYFFPGYRERSIEHYVYLLSFLEAEDLVMRNCTNGVELLVFTTKQQHYAKDLNWVSFLWGVLRTVKTEDVTTTPSILSLGKQAIGFGYMVEDDSNAAHEDTNGKLLPMDLEVPARTHLDVVHALPEYAKTYRRTNLSRRR